MDAVVQNLELAEKNGDIMDQLGLEEGGYFLATAHRQENVDNRERFQAKKLLELFVTQERKDEIYVFDGF